MKRVSGSEKDDTETKLPLKLNNQLRVGATTYHIGSVTLDSNNYEGPGQPANKAITMGVKLLRSQEFSSFMSLPRYP